MDWKTGIFRFVFLLPSNAVKARLERRWRVERFSLAPFEPLFVFLHPRLITVLQKHQKANNTSQTNQHWEKVLQPPKNHIGSHTNPSLAA
uniref:hypothetical protein n=1 Tax=Pseudomonas syringae TaxID=317 RepID=UPI001E439AB0|nr:hypothetical protein [Pseudomonas syringae]